MKFAFSTAVPVRLPDARGARLRAGAVGLQPNDTAPDTRPQNLVVRCECGFEVRGSADEVVAGIEHHALKNHNMRTTREQVLARAQPV